MPERPLDLAKASPDTRAAFLEVYEIGFLDGVSAGRRELEAEWRGRMEVSAAIARFIATQPSYAELAERRGQPERAARQRQILAERGVSA